MSHVDSQGRLIFASPFTKGRKKTAKKKKRGKWRRNREVTGEGAHAPRHAARLPDCLIHRQCLCRHHCLWKSKHSTWFWRWSETPRVKPAVFISCSLYPPGVWGATKPFIPPIYTLSSTSRELTDIDWQLMYFWFWCAFIFGWLCVLVYPFLHIMLQWCFLFKHPAICVWIRSFFGNLFSNCIRILVKSKSNLACLLYVYRIAPRSILSFYSISIRIHFSFL